VRVLAEELVELHRPEPERVVERHVGAEAISAEPPKIAKIVALIEAGALLEHNRDISDR
jgi:hypothetical protein